MNRREGTAEHVPGPIGERPDASRRRWLVRAGAICAGLVALPGRAAGLEWREEEEEVSPPEDLMREHGVLKRVLLVYEEAIRRIEAKHEIPLEAVRQAADIIRTFIEGYHERLEEDHLFPLFEKAGRLADLTRVLRVQHQAGRRLTDQIARLASPQALKDPASAATMRDAMRAFIRMYGPHQAREDTVLFPALRTIVTRQVFGALGDEFEKREHVLFGEDGFEKMVDRVASIEKTLGIYDLGQFTPGQAAGSAR
jgi:hemerythrin-like domain-containing protein